MRYLLFLVLVSSTLLSYGFPEYYYKITKNSEQKKEFIKILKPLIEEANMQTLSERTFIENFFQSVSAKSFREFSTLELSMIIKLAKKYRVKSFFDKAQLLKKIDIVPVSLALTQGAIESGWGKSRFVRLANNIFGHWTWGEVGLLPLEREEGRTHKIRIFKTLQASVDAYILNLNRNYAYKEFRELRYKTKKEGKKFGGLSAASTMINYSELDDKYIKMLQNMMNSNGFLAYD